jgi:hypothetical protein
MEDKSGPADFLDTTLENIVPELEELTLELLELNSLQDLCKWLEIDWSSASSLLSFEVILAET